MTSHCGIVSKEIQGRVAIDKGFRQQDASALASGGGDARSRENSRNGWRRSGNAVAFLY
jgi:hypothetical protein